MKYRFRSGGIRLRRKVWGSLYLNEGCMEDKDRRILFGLRDGGMCDIFSLATGLDWNLQKFCTDDLYATHNF